MYFAHLFDSMYVHVEYDNGFCLHSASCDQIDYLRFVLTLATYLFQMLAGVKSLVKYRWKMVIISTLEYNKYLSEQ